MKMVNGLVIQGHAVASGKGKDARYPDGTLRLQAPFFLEGGLDINRFYTGTINLDVSPYTFEIRRPKYFFREIKWSPYIPPENFYFFDLIAYYQKEVYEGLIYMPDPETKTDHHQHTQLLELLLPELQNLNYGDNLKIRVPNDQLRFFKTV
ncbi:MAG: hypothetical protein KJO20_14465 [Eudoraea sp.]|nr:hypothetical protein [Eudoraea sp.]NNK29488.1 hypothetical protein [Flavobacteriaceae bacterium]